MNDVMITDDLLDQLVAFELLEVTDEDVMRAVGISVEQFNIARESQGYREILARETIKEHERRQLNDEGWDSVEKVALTNILETMAWSKDPDYALKAAAVANKAIRNRRGKGNATIVPGETGARAVIYLERKFVTRVQSDMNGVSKTIEETQVIKAVIPKKDTNMLNPAAVEQLMAPETVRKLTDEDEIDAYLEEAF